MKKKNKIIAAMNKLKKVGDIKVEEKQKIKIVELI